MSSESLEREAVERTEILPSEEGIKFAEAVKEDVLKTFPFKSEEEKDRFLEAFASAIDSEALSDPTILPSRIRLALKTLENTHTVLGENYEGHSFRLEKPIYYKAGKFWVDVENKAVEVLSIDGTLLEDLIEEKRNRISGGTEDWQIIEALREVNSSELETNARLQTPEGDIEFPFTGKSTLGPKVVDEKILEGDIGYLNIPTWSQKVTRGGKDVGELVEEAFQKIKECDSFIIDVRQNGGGKSSYAEQLARHFMDKRRKFADSIRKGLGKNGLKEVEFHVSPDGEFLDKKVVILTSPTCLSSCELFILMLKDTGRAITVGQTTGGGSGNAAAFPLRLGDKDFTLKVSTWRVIRNNGQELENVGIEPDIPVEITPEDVVSRRDVELEKALEYLKTARK